MCLDVSRKQEAIKVSVGYWFPWATLRQSAQASSNWPVPAWRPAWLPKRSSYTEKRRNHSAYAMPLRKGGKMRILFLKMLLYLRSTGLVSCEEVANRKHGEGPEGGLMGTNKELWHMEAQHWSIILSKKKKSFFFFWGLRVWNTDKIQLLSILNECGWRGTCATAASWARLGAAASPARWSQPRNSITWPQFPPEASRCANSITLLLYISCCFLIQLKSL